MNAETYRRYLSEFVAWAEAEPEVVGLVAVGSTARLRREPDRWSDHDLVAITPADAVSTMVERGAWFPDAGSVAVRFADPERCINAIYDDGHLVELAVTDPDDLAWLGPSEHRLLVGDRHLAARLADVGTHGPDVLPGDDGDVDVPYHRFVKELVVGAARLRRGEFFSASQRIRGNALHLLLELVAATVDTDRPDVLDRLDATRRFHLAYPDLARGLEPALDGSLGACARTLVAVAGTTLVGRVPGATARSLAAVTAALDRA